jgi:hypothetical protein
MNSVQIFFKTYICSQFRLDHLPEKTTPLYSSLHKPYELKKKSKILNQPIDRVHWLMHQGDVTLWIWLCWLLRISHCFSPISQYLKVFFIFLAYMPGGFATTIPLFCYLLWMCSQYLHILRENNIWCDNWELIILTMSELLGIPLWTSASSEGQYCALDRTFAWCTTGTVVEQIFLNDTILWDSTPKGSALEGNCVAMSLKTDESSAQLSLATCSDSKSYMCQVFKLSYLTNRSCTNVTIK